MTWPNYNVIPQLSIEQFHSFFEVHYDKGYHFTGEIHNFWECVYIVDGTMCVSGDDRVYNLETGQIIFHKPMELHKFHIDSEKGTTLLIFSFSLNGNLASELQNKVYRLSDPQQHIIRSLREYMLRNLSQYPAQSPVYYSYSYTLPFENNPLYSQMVTTYIYQLFLSLLETGKISKVSKAPDALLFGKAVNYISSRTSGQPSVAEIARAVNTSVSTLKRIFQKYAGMSVHKYTLETKLKAATLLLQDGTSVTEVAERLGFSSQAYFSACYKRETGLSPSEVL